MRKELISVIVPVYNVAPYLGKCLESLLSQTYPQLEIILVDDGSTDGSREICAACARRDGRVKVHHLAHQGVGAARNAGLNTAGGAYIGWTDADDWLDPGMFARLKAGLEAQQADIAVGGYQLHLPGRVECFQVSEGEKLDTPRGLEYLLAGAWFGNFLWNKLFGRELFQGLRFPEGTFFEEINITHKLFARARSIALCPGADYHYVRRSDSIIGARSLAHNLDACEQHIARYMELAAQPALLRFLAQDLLEVFLHTVFTGMRGTAAERQAARPRRERLSAFLAAHGEKILPYLGAMDRLTLHWVQANHPLADMGSAAWAAWRKLRRAWRRHVHA